MHDDLKIKRLSLLAWLLATVWAAAAIVGLLAGRYVGAVGAVTMTGLSLLAVVFLRSARSR